MDDVFFLFRFSQRSAISVADAATCGYCAITTVIAHGVKMNTAASIRKIDAALREARSELVKLVGDNDATGEITARFVFHGGGIRLYSLSRGVTIFARQVD